MLTNVKAKKRLTQVIIAFVVICLAVTGSAFLLNDFVKDASAADRTIDVSDIATLNNAIRTAPTDGTSLEIRLTGNTDYVATAKLEYVRPGANIIINMNGHNVIWDVVTSSCSTVIPESYTSGSYKDGTFWGLFTNNGGRLEFTGNGTIRNKKIAQDIQHSSSGITEHPQKVAAIVNSGTLTLGARITVESYLSYVETYNRNTAVGSYRRETHLYCFGIDNSGGTVISSANITAGTICTGTMSSSTGSASVYYAIDYGIYGGNVTTNGGTIKIDAYAGGSYPYFNSYNGNRFASVAVGVYANNAQILGETNITTQTKTWASRADDKDIWNSDSGQSFMWSSGVVYDQGNIANVPQIGPAVSITSGGNIANNESIPTPGNEGSRYTYYVNSKTPVYQGYMLSPVAGVTQNNTYPPVNKNEVFANGTGFGVARESLMTFSGVTHDYYTEYVSHSTSTASGAANQRQQRDLTTAPVKVLSGKTLSFNETASISNGVNNGNSENGQYVIVYRYFNGSRTAANLEKVSYTPDTNINTEAYVNVNGSRGYKGVIRSGETVTAAMANGKYVGDVLNKYYYDFAAISYEAAASSDYVHRDIDDLSAWVKDNSSLTKNIKESGSANLTNATTTLVIYFDYVKRVPTLVRVAADDIDAETITAQTAAKTATPTFKTSYKGRAIVAGTDFQFAIIDIGKDKSVGSNDRTDDTLVTDIYNITGSAGRRVVSYEYAEGYLNTADSAIASNFDTAKIDDGLPTDAGTYTIRVTVSEDITTDVNLMKTEPSGYAIGSGNRAGQTAYITCEITKGEVVIQGKSEDTVTYGDSTLGAIFNYRQNAYIARDDANNINLSQNAGSFAFDGYEFDERLNAGDYYIDLIWTPSGNYAKNYDSAHLTLHLTVNKRNVKVYLPNEGSVATYGSNDVSWADLEFENLAACDEGKVSAWQQDSTFQIYYNGGWTAYSSDVPVGIYDAKILRFGGSSDTNNIFTVNSKGENHGKLDVQNAPITYRIVPTNRSYNGSTTVDIKLEYVSGALADAPGYGPSYDTTGEMYTPDAGDNKAFASFDTEDIRAALAKIGYSLNIQNRTVTVDIWKIDPVNVGVHADPSSDVYNATRKLSDVTLVPETASDSTPGKWEWQSPNTKPEVPQTTYKAVFTPTDTVNYNTLEVDVGYTLTKATVTVYVPDQQVIYGNSLEKGYAELVQYDGFTGNESIANNNVDGLRGSVRFASDYSAGKDVGTYDITVTTTQEADNYKFVTRETKNKVTVLPRPIKIRVADKTVSYGDAAPAYRVTSPDLTVVSEDGFYGFYNRDTFSTLGNLTFSHSYTSTSPVADYEVTLNGITNGNYAVTVVSGTIHVQKAQLTITPDTQTVYFGQDAPASFTYKATLKNGNLAPDGAFTGTPTFSTDYEVGDNVANYTIRVNNVNELTSTNYTIVARDGVLAVEKAVPSFDKALNYYAPTGILYHNDTYKEATLNGYVAGNPYNASLPTVKGTFVFDTPDAIAYANNGNIEAVATFIPNAPDSDNYEEASGVIIVLYVYEKDITGKPVIKGTPMIGEKLTADLSGMEPSTASEYDFEWYVGGQKIDGATTAEYVIQSDNENMPITVKVTAKAGRGYRGSAESDPTIPVVPQDGTMVKAEPGMFDIALTQSKVYDKVAVDATTITVHDEYIIGTPTIKYNGSTSLPVAAGHYYVTLDLTAPAESGEKTRIAPVSGMYIGEFDIMPKTITAVIDDADGKFDKDYDGSRIAQGEIVLDGLLPGDTVSVTGDYTLAYDSANAGERDVYISGTITLTGADAANYTLELASGIATIRTIPLYATIQPIDRDYNGSPIVDVTFSNVHGYASVDSAFSVYYLSRGTAQAVSADAGVQSIINVLNKENLLAGTSAQNYHVAIENEQTAHVEIFAIVPDVDIPQLTGWVYNKTKTLKATAIDAFNPADGSGTWAFVDESTIPEVAVSAYPAVYTPKNTNYLPLTVDVPLTITPAPVKIQVETVSINYGTEPEKFNFIAAGLTGDDTLTSLPGAGVWATVKDYVAGSDVGRYDIVVSYDYDTLNYTFDTSVGALIVNPAPFYVTAAAENRTYDPNLNTVKVTFATETVPFGNDDVRLSYTETNGTPASSNAGTSKVTYTAPTLTGLGDKYKNYYIVLSPASGDLLVEIYKADLTVVFPTEATLEFGYNLSYAVFTTAGQGEGTFAYADRTAVPPGLGEYNDYVVVFTPYDSINYNSQSKTVKLIVNPCQVTFTLAILGNPQEEQRLSTSTTGLPARAMEYIQYKWYRFDPDTGIIEEIKDATESFYVATSDDVGYSLIVVAYFDKTAPYYINENIIDSVDGGVTEGVLAQTASLIEQLALTFWQRLVRWIYRIIAAITGLKFEAH